MFLTEMNKKLYFTLLIFMFFVSGACCLIYEIAWMQMLKLVFGSTIYASSLVLASLMAGFAIGSYAFGRYTAGKNISHLKLLGLLYLGTGLYSFFTPAVFHFIQYIMSVLPLSRYTVTVINEVRAHSLSSIFLSVLFILSFVSLGIPSVLMGGTLPVIVKLFEKRFSDYGKNVGILYSVNTWGGVLGIILCTYVLFLYLGIKGALYFACILNILSGVVLLKLRAEMHPEKEKPEIKNEISIATGNQKIFHLILPLIGISGFTAFGYEILWTRILSMVIGSSAYAFSLMLGIFLSGIAAGSYIYSKYQNKFRFSHLMIFALIQAVIGIFTLIILPFFADFPLLMIPFYKIAQYNFLLSQIVQVFIIIIILFIPAVCFGATVPLASVIYRKKSQGVSSIAYIYTSNSVGSVFGSLLTGFVFIPFLGIQRTFYLMIGLNLLMGIVILHTTRDSRKKIKTIVTAGCIIFLSLYISFLPPWNKRRLTSGLYNLASRYLSKSHGKIAEAKQLSLNNLDRYDTVYYKEGLHYTVAVNEYNSGFINLTIDGKPDASNDIRGDMFTQVLLGHLPMLIHPNPKRVLVIGLASGTSLGMVTRWTNVKEIDCLDIEAAMIHAAQYFNQWNNQPLKDPRVKLIIDDARNYLQYTDKKYDVIISEPSNPWVAGCGPLFSKENFDLIKKRLEKTGIYAIWLQLYNLDISDYKSIVNTISIPFTNLSIWHTQVSDTVIVTTPDRLLLDYGELKQKLAFIKDDLKDLQLDDINAFLTRFIMVPRFREAGINTDDKPMIVYNTAKNLFLPKRSRIVLENLRKEAEPVTDYLAGIDNYEPLIKNYLNNNQFLIGERIIQERYAPGGSGQYYFLLGYSAFRQNKNFEAIDYFQKAVRINPNYSEAYINMANAYIRNKDDNRAFYLVRKALSINPKSAEAWNLSGSILLRRMKYKEAFESFMAGKKADPNFAASYINLALVYMNYLKDFKNAIEELKVAMKLNKTDAFIYYLAGIAYLYLDNAPEAENMFARAVFFNSAYIQKIKNILNLNK